MEGSDEKYLFINSSRFNNSWIVWSSLKGDKGFIASASSGHPCPAHPINKTNTVPRYDFKDWLFNDAEGNKFDFKEGGVEIKCSVHLHPSSPSGPSC